MVFHEMLRHVTKWCTILHLCDFMSYHDMLTHVMCFMSCVCACSSAVCCGVMWCDVVWFGVMWCGVMWCGAVYILRYCAIWCCVRCHTTRWTTSTQGMHSSPNLSAVPFLSSSLSPTSFHSSHSFWSLSTNHVVNILITWMITRYTHILEQLNICPVNTS